MGLLTSCFPQAIRYQYSIICKMARESFLPLWNHIVSRTRPTVKYFWQRYFFSKVSSVPFFHNIVNKTYIQKSHRSSLCDYHYQKLRQANKGKSALLSFFENKTRKTPYGFAGCIYLAQFF